MEKKHSFFLALLITLLIAGNYLFFYDFSSGREIVLVSRVIDGDTLELADGRTIRLLNINTPERREFAYEEAFNYLKEYENKTVELESEGVGSYGRVLGRLFYDSEYINLNLVKNGLAHSYIVSDNELDEFKDAEKIARENNIGLWKKSDKFGCLKAEINKKDEYVIFDSLCGNIEGWNLKDESTNSYTFKKVEAEKFILYSEKGEDGKDKFYWGRGNSWNDDKDSIYVRDEKGNLVYYDSYGY